MSHRAEILTPDEMYRADAHAVKMGVPSLTLMENAGAAVAGEISKRWWPRKIVVLCGPGNNGGDGFVVARLLREAGWPVEVALHGTRERLKGDAAAMAERWEGRTFPLEAIDPTQYHLIIDCLFGAGLARDIEGPVADLIGNVNSLDVPVVAVDLPSGMDGRTGKCRAKAFEAALTVTFHRKKPGHLLFPGAKYCGETVCADIGIPDAAMAEIAPRLTGNEPALWKPMLKELDAETHKYRRGMALIVSGDEFSTGAARLAARAAFRSGAGLVRVAGDKAALRVHAAHVSAIMLAPVETLRDFARLLEDKRYSAVCIGPGNGLGEATRGRVRHALAAGCPVVLDADALTSFESDPATLFTQIKANPERGVVMTPHTGEFQRLFPELVAEPGKVEQARKAAEKAGAVIILKGPDTVIASPQGYAAINTHASADLATAGSGDVLAGLITGVLVQGMPAYYAACVSVWIHGETGFLGGPGLIADDLPNLIPQAFKSALA